MRESHCPGPKHGYTMVYGVQSPLSPVPCVLPLRRHSLYSLQKWSFQTWSPPSDLYAFFVRLFSLVKDSQSIILHYLKLKTASTHFLNSAWTGLSRGSFEVTGLRSIRCRRTTELYNCETLPRGLSRTSATFVSECIRDRLGSTFTSPQCNSQWPGRTAPSQIGAIGAALNAPPARRETGNRGEWAIVHLKQSGTFNII